jgi:hypothetical protein
MAAGRTFSSIPTAPATGAWPVATKGGRRPLHWASTRLEARTARDATNRLLACDVDPSQARKKQKRAARLSGENTFEIVAREWCENQKDGWTARYHDHVVTRLEADVFPEFGARPIAEVDPPELLAVLRKVEKCGALEIAKRLQQTVGQIFR